MKKTDRAIIVDKDTKKIADVIAKVKRRSLRAVTRIALEEYSVNHQIDIEQIDIEQ